MKRVFDVFFSGLGMLLLSPVLVLIGLLILCFDGRPVLFHQERIGYRRKQFKMHKFRTMIRDADKVGKPLTVGDDPRVTRLGHWLRKTKFDELPQLFNVFSGNMSFVGPRPEVERYVAHYTPDQCRVLELVPGITDAASIRFRCESELLTNLDNPEQTYIEEIVPEKIRINLEYAERAGLLRDCAIILQTVAGLCRGNKTAVVAACSMTWTAL